MSSANLGDSEAVVHNIAFSGTEGEYITDLTGQIINIHVGDGKHKHSSSKMKLTDKTDYNWEMKFYNGHLVTAHMGNQIMAYAMKGQDGGMVRVANIGEFHNRRLLIKNLGDEIKDLAFAYIRDEIILGCVDSYGNIYVYNIEDSQTSLNYTLLLHIARKESVVTNNNFRLIWCPFLGMDDEGDDPEKMFVVLNGKKAEIYSIAILNTKYGSEGPLTPDKTYEGYLEISHTAEIVDASFSADGCAIALACQDGYVMFYQMYMCSPDMSKCLHEWLPHDGKPISSVTFADNIMDVGETCWKFAITGANHNTELKLWSCESWSCLQTINFIPNPQGRSNLQLNISVDYTGKYMVLSDVFNRGIYLLELTKNENDQLIQASLLTHFLVHANFLSFHILEAGLKGVIYSYPSDENIFAPDDYDYDDETEIFVHNLKLLVIQPRKFQECSIMYQPETFMHQGIVTKGLDALENGDIIVEDEPIPEKVPELEELQNSVSLLIQQQQSNTTKMTLMTPDQFTSPGKTSKASSVHNSVTQENNYMDIEKLGEGSPTPRKGFASAGSSPSREVESIFCSNNSSSEYPTQDVYNNASYMNVQSEQEQPQKDYSDPPVSWRQILVSEPEVIKQISEQSLDRQHLEQLQLKITHLENNIKEMSLVMTNMKDQLHSLNGVSRRDVEDIIGKEVDAGVAKHQLYLAKAIENLQRMQKSASRELQENVLGSMTQILSKTISENVAHSVQKELHQMMPGLFQNIDAHRVQTEMQLNHKFASIDGLIKENFAKVLTSKGLVDGVSMSVVNMMTPILEKSYKECITTSLIPACEKLCTQMFQQLNDTFTRGTKEYTTSVETYVERQRKVQEKGKELVGQMQGVSESLKMNCDKMGDTLSAEINKQFTTVFKNIQDKWIHTIKEIVSQEIRHSFKNHVTIIEEGVLNAVSRSRTVTPAPAHDPHVQMTQIQQALSRKAFDEAFQIALTAENLNLVINLCEKVDEKKIFGEKCLLSQSVLLALIQQLSMEMHVNPGIKLSFIRSAILALDTNQLQTKKFIPDLLEELIKQLSIFLAGTPPANLLNDARFLKMAVESMLSSLRATAN